MSRRTFVELLKECAWGPSFGLEQDAHDVIELLPTVHGLLELLLTFLDEDVDDAGIGDIAILLEVLADAVADVGGRDIEGV